MTFFYYNFNRGKIAETDNRQLHYQKKMKTQNQFLKEKRQLCGQSIDLPSRQHHSQIGPVHEERSIHMGDAKLRLFLSSAQE